MSSTVSTGYRGHPITVAAAQIHDRLDDLVDQPTWSMSAEETRAALVELTRLGARVAELELRLAAHAAANRVGEETGATSTANWWAQQTRITRAEAHRRTRLAGDLDAVRHQPVRAALAAGEVVPDQAAVIVDAVEALPEEVSATIVAQAEGFLLDQAGDHDARALRVLGRRLLEVVDPETADAHEARLLAKEEEAARAAASLRMIEDGHGRCQGRFSIPTLHGAMLKKALLAIAAPKHQAAAQDRSPSPAPVPGRPSDQRLGAAFLEYLETYPADRLPASGGVSATVVVTMTLETLLGGLKATSLDTGERLSAGQARRLACSAGIIPAVLGGQSQVLDLGRTRRFHTTPQRLALGVAQGGCTAEGCDWPPGLCHAHHHTPWSRGGTTDLSNGRLLCPRHHALTHQADTTPSYHPRI